MLKVYSQDYLYHQITAYDHVIAYARFTCAVVDTKSVLNYLSARRLWHAKRWHLDVACISIQTCGYTVLYFIRSHTTPMMFCMPCINHAAISSDIPQVC